MPKQVITGLHHFALRAPDLSQSIAFYQALGFHQVHDWRLASYHIDHAVMMQAPDRHSWIELFNMKAEIPLQGIAAQVGQQVATGAMAHICLSVTDLDCAIEQITTAGAKHLYGPESLALGVPAVQVRNAIFEGPAGEVIELLQATCFPGDLPPPNPSLQATGDVA